MKQMSDSVTKFCVNKLYAYDLRKLLSEDERQKLSDMTRGLFDAGFLSYELKRGNFTFEELCKIAKKYYAEHLLEKEKNEQLKAKYSTREIVRKIKTLGGLKKHIIIYHYDEEDKDIYSRIHGKDPDERKIKYSLPVGLTDEEKSFIKMKGSNHIIKEVFK